MTMLVARPCPNLPVELWWKILREATMDDDSDAVDTTSVVMHPQPPNGFPGRKSLPTKLAFMQVSTRWNRLAREFLWEYVGNRTQEQLVDIASRLNNNGERGEGWWIRALHTRFNFGDNIDIFISSIISILKCCPNLSSFAHIHDFNGAFPTSVITSLTTLPCSKKLQSFQLGFGGANMDDLVLLLEKADALRYLSVGCTFSPVSFPSASIPPREIHARSLRSIHFGNAEDGMARRFNCHLLDATNWIMPSLANVSIDLDARTSVEELVGFLQVHGPGLSSLSLTDSGPRIDGLALDWTHIFTLCPDLTQLMLFFNPFLQSSGDHHHHRPLISNTASIARKLQRLSFAGWEFFPHSDSIPDAMAYSELRLILDKEFEALVGESCVTPLLKVVQFDFHGGRLDLPPCCIEWWGDWLKKWSDRGLVVEGCNRVVLNSGLV